ncbi:hypothetical protein [Shigella boydii]|uniref:hypothetical protein n=1 Tax=Shigella boydii TaxID=621 RepID=UPI00020A5423|nr:hypothetical protein [Shigella boydii]EGI98899.1 hypothetical protein SB521682_0808 [Shigella boydii 5216-82]MDS1504001.1 hypothetical protein [Shigella boydii]
MVISLLGNKFYTGKDKVTFDYVLAAKLRDAGLAIERNYLVDMATVSADSSISWSLPHLVEVAH